MESINLSIPSFICDNINLNFGLREIRMKLTVIPVFLIFNTII